MLNCTQRRPVAATASSTGLSEDRGKIFVKMPICMDASEKGGDWLGRSKMRRTTNEATEHCYFGIGSTCAVSPGYELLHQLPSTNGINGWFGFGRSEIRGCRDQQKYGNAGFDFHQRWECR